MNLARVLSLLLLAGLPDVAGASLGPQPGQGAGVIGDSLAVLRPSAAAESVSVDECDSSNVLRRLSGCSDLINSGAVKGADLAHAHRRRGMALFSLGEMRRAIDDFDRAIAITGGTAALHLARGTARQHLGEYAGARDDLLKAVELAPENATAFASLGATWEKLGRDERALAAYDRALALDPENAIVLNNRGNVLARMGRRGQAIEAYDRALRLNPDYATAYYNRAGERCLDGQAGPAVADYLDAIRLGERQRLALEDFLSGAGYFQAASGPAATGALESALRRWSASACMPTGPVQVGPVEVGPVQVEDGGEKMAEHPGEEAI